MSTLIRAITDDGTVLATAIDSTDMVGRAEQIHSSSATVTAAIGRLLTAASMMGSMLKNEDDMLTLRLAGGGPAGTLIAVGDERGNARVTVTNPVVELPLNDKGKLDVAGAVGTNGFLAVIRDSGNAEPQTGYTPIISGEIAEDITSYYATSEQLPTVCALGVLVNPDLHVAAAGGILLQLLPGAGEDTIEILEENLKHLPAVSSMVHEGMTPLEMLQCALQGFNIEVVDQHEVEYQCNCSRERVERVLISLGTDELERLETEQSVTEVDCHFCEKHYLFSSEELHALIQK